ncbi:hypothetical protein [Streptomyces sp. NPDC087300]
MAAAASPPASLGSRSPPAAEGEALAQVAILAMLAEPPHPLGDLV